MVINSRFRGVGSGYGVWLGREGWGGGESVRCRGGLEGETVMGEEGGGVLVVEGGEGVGSGYRVWLGREGRVMGRRYRVKEEEGKDKGKKGKDLGKKGK